MMSKNICSTVEGHNVGNGQCEKLTYQHNDELGWLNMCRSDSRGHSDRMCLCTHFQNRSTRASAESMYPVAMMQTRVPKAGSFLRKNFSFYFKLLDRSVTHNASVKRSGQGTRAGHIKPHSLPLQQNILKLFKVCPRWR